MSLLSQCRIGRFIASRPLVDRELREEVHAPVVRRGRLTLLSQTDDAFHARVACIARERRGRSSQVEWNKKGVRQLDGGSEYVFKHLHTRVVECAKIKLSQIRRPAMARTSKTTGKTERRW